VDDNGVLKLFFNPLFCTTINSLANCSTTSLDLVPSSTILNKYIRIWR